MKFGLELFEALLDELHPQVKACSFFFNIPSFLMFAWLLRYIMLLRLDGDIS